MKGYIHLKLDVQMKRYVEPSQNESLMLDGHALDLSKYDFIIY